MKSTNITKVDAKASLDELKRFGIENERQIRSPIGFILVAAFSIALLSTSICAARHDNIWMMGVFVGVALNLFTWFLHLQLAKLKGINHKIIPKTASGWKVTLGVALFIVISTFVGRQLSENGYEWVSYLVGAINGVFIFFAIYRFPTNDNIFRDV